MFLTPVESITEAGVLLKWRVERGALQEERIRGLRGPRHRRYNGKCGSKNLDDNGHVCIYPSEVLRLFSCNYSNTLRGSTSTGYDANRVYHILFINTTPALTIGPVRVQCSNDSGSVKVSTRPLTRKNPVHTLVSCIYVGSTKIFLKYSGWSGRFTYTEVVRNPAGSPENVAGKHLQTYDLKAHIVFKSNGPRTAHGGT